MKWRTIGAVAALLVVAGCGDSPMDVNDGEPADGEVDGESWEFIAGTATPDEDMGDYDIVLADYDLECGEIDESEASFVEFNAEPDEGTQSSTITYSRVDGFDFSVAMGQGEFEITEWGEDTVYGSIDHEHSEEDWVDGDFAARLCE